VVLDLTLQNQLDRPNHPENLSPVAGVFRDVIDIEETADGLRVTAEVPGMKKEDIHVEFENGLLTIRGERTRESKTEEKAFHRVERSYGSFVRTFRLPASIDAEQITANYSEGILTLEMPKAEEAKARRIEIGNEGKTIEARPRATA
jgi:HSP20 family protein